MSVYKRGTVYWYAFTFNGHRVQEPTRQRNKRVAETMEAAHRTRLALGEVGIIRRKPPRLDVFAKTFITSIRTRSKARPRTADFYAEKMDRLLEFKPFAEARLNVIDEGLIDQYVQQRLKTKIKNRDRTVSIATVNRELATLRRALRLAMEWKMLDRVPKIRLLPGERGRNFVLNYSDETRYLEKAPDPLKDIALLILDSGLRISEAVGLKWTEVSIDPAPGSRLGFLEVLEGKSVNAPRTLSLTPRLGEMLAFRRRFFLETGWVFPGKGPQGHITHWHIDNQHRKLRTDMGFGPEFVVHSLRHTFATRLGESGADAFQIMRLMGHSSVTVSQKYVHPTPETMERAIERLNMLNETVGRKVGTTKSTTVDSRSL